MNPSQATFPVVPPFPGISLSNDADVLYEVVNGKHLELPHMGAFECWLASRLIVALAPFCESRSLGRAVVETLFLLNTETDLQRRPDLAYVSYQRWAKTLRVPSTNAWPVVPDLAVEVVSSSNTVPGIMAKIREYFEAGCLAVWVVVPTEEQIYVYHSPTQTRILGKTDVLDDEVLPDFRLPLAQLFVD